MRVVEIDYLEPVEAAAAFAGTPGFTFLDSAMAQPRMGRHAFVAAEPFGHLRARGSSVAWNGEPLDLPPLGALASMLARYRAETAADLPPFQGGAAGLFSYDLAHSLERLPRPACDDLAFPDLSVFLYDAVVAFDIAERRAWVISTGFPEQGRAARAARADARARRLLARLGQRAPAPSRPAPVVPHWRSNFTRADYERAVARVVEYILAGDIFQANIAQRFSAPLPPGFDPWAFYRRLREVNPAPFAAYLDHGDFTLASASPERFLQVAGRQVETRPIKGTRPAGDDPHSDAANVRALRDSRKDRAENVMIVDLLRNDLSRVCEPGSIAVPELCALESFAGLHHLVSAVTGILQEGAGALDLLASAFPGGSITGAPKLRAMEIIAALEGHARGPYCGAIGYVGFDGAMDTSIVIRTAAFRDGVAVVQAGGGVVAASDPAKEYDETLVKARRMFEAFGAAPPSPSPRLRGEEPALSLSKGARRADEGQLDAGWLASVAKGETPTVSAAPHPTPLRGATLRQAQGKPFSPQAGRRGRAAILVVDNYDSFVHTIARYLRERGAEALVVRNDAIDVAALANAPPDAIVISPGPCTPDEAGVSLALVRRFSGVVPILGICLGHQCIGQVFGGRVTRARRPMHGEASAIHHDGCGLFGGLPTPLEAGRYHSLIVELDDPASPLAVTARSPEGEIMALAHRTHPTFGVQFHPESILTDGGHALLANFLRLARTPECVPG